MQLCTLLHSRRDDSQRQELLRCVTEAVAKHFGFRYMRVASIQATATDVSFTSQCFFWVLSRGCLVITL